MILISALGTIHRMTLRIPASIVFLILSATGGWCGEHALPVVSAEQVPLSTPVWIVTNGVSTECLPWTEAYYKLRIENQVYLDDLGVLRFSKCGPLEFVERLGTNVDAAFDLAYPLNLSLIHGNSGDYMAYAHGTPMIVRTQNNTSPPPRGCILTQQLSAISETVPNTISLPGAVPCLCYRTVSSPTLDAYLAMATNGLADASTHATTPLLIQGTPASEESPAYALPSAQGVHAPMHQPPPTGDKSSRDRAIRDLHYRQNDLNDRRTRKEQVLHSLEQALENAESDEEREALKTAIARTQSQIGISQFQYDGASNSLREIEAAVPTTNTPLP